MSRLHTPDNLIRDKDRDFLGDDGHYWFAFLCPSESRAAEHHRHVYQVRDDGAVAYCTCPYATNGGACTLVLCAPDIARAEREREAGGPPADPGGAARDAAPGALDLEQGAWRRWTIGRDAYAEELMAQLAEVGEETPPYPYPLPTLDEAVALVGNRWIQSRTAAGVRLVCASCGAVRGWASEGMATAWLEGGGACSCGGPTPPAPGAARKPIAEHLAVLYGE